MKINWIDMLRDVGLLWALSFSAEVIVLIVHGGHISQDPDAINAVGTAKQAAVVFGFAVAGSLGRKPSRERLWHLLEVLIGFWVINLSNTYFIPNYTFVAWLISSWPLTVYAVVGGGLSLLFASPSDPHGCKDQDIEPSKPTLGE